MGKLFNYQSLANFFVFPPLAKGVGGFESIEQYLNPDFTIDFSGKI